MTIEECTQLLAPLAVTLRTQLDVPQFRAYHRALQDVPVPLFARAVDVAAASCEFFPKPAELRALAERERQGLLESHPYDGCAECEAQRGWRNVLVEGVSRVERCPCRSRWIQKLEGMGVTQQKLLTEARELEPAS